MNRTRSLLTSLLALACLLLPILPGSVRTAWAQTLSPPSSRSSNVYDLHAAALPGAIDNTAYTGTGVSGITGAAGTAPTYHATGFQGYPALSFNGSQFLSGTNASLDAVFTSGHSWTISMLISSHVSGGNYGDAATNYGGLFCQGSNVSGNAISLLQAGGQVALYANQVNSGYFPAQDIPKLLSVVHDATVGGANGTTTFYLNGVPAGSPSTAALGAYVAGQPYLVGIYGGAGNPGFQGLIMDVSADNSALTQTQIQSELAYYASIYPPIPSITPAEFRFVGDSRTLGIDTRYGTGSGQTQVTLYPYPLQLQNTYGTQLTTLLNLPMGAPSPRWTNSGIGGLSIEGPTSITTNFGLNYNPFCRQIWFLLIGVNDLIGGTPVATALADVRAYVDNLVSLKVPLVLATELSAGSGGWEGAGNFKNTYVAGLVSSYSNTPKLQLVRTDLDALIGVDGSSTNATYWSPDNLHPTGQDTSGGPAGGGYKVLATDMGMAGITLLTPTVSNVSVSPPTVSLAGAQAQQFAVTVSGTNSPAQTVTWTASAGSITSGGLFTAPAATTGAQTITITATSTVDTSQSGVATVTVPALPVAAAPTFSPAAGTYTSSQTVTLATTTSGATIRYTVDGSTPSETVGTVYSAPITVGTSETVKEVAYKAGYTDSAVASATYVINLPSGGSPLSSSDINAIAVAVVAQLQASGAIVVRPQMVTGPVALLAAPSGTNTVIAVFVGDKPAWAFDLIDDDGSPNGREVSIPSGATITATTSRLGTIVSSAVSVAVPNAGRGRIVYTAQATDTAVAGKLNLTITVAAADGSTIDTYGPVAIMVRSK